MKCPLLTDKNYGEQLERTMQKGDCIREECAWWSASGETCSVLELSRLLCALGGVVSEALVNRGEVHPR